jgi:hypothetical protein
VKKILKKIIKKKRIFLIMDNLPAYKYYKIFLGLILFHTIVICITRLRNPTLTNREKNCRQGRFAAETRQSRGRQRIS